jgi:ParB family transcriptional regulator, chromosome partitioning protein
VALFEALGVRGEARRNTDAYRLCEVFVALIAMSDEEVMEVLAFAMAQTRDAGGPVFEAVRAKSARRTCPHTGNRT